MIRYMIRRHLRPAVALDRAISPEPWRIRKFRSTMRDRQTIGLVAEERGRMAGFIIYRYGQSVELLKITAASRKVAVALIEKMVFNVRNKLGYRPALAPASFLECRTPWRASGRRGRYKHSPTAAATTAKNLGKSS